jgi:ribosomal 50S subunit-recycling heat shock protein
MITNSNVARQTPKNTKKPLRFLKNPYDAKKVESMMRPAFMGKVPDQLYSNVVVKQSDDGDLDYSIHSDGNSGGSISEASRREKIANAVLGATFGLYAAQSPEHFVTTGKIEAPGTALMQRWVKTRGEAERNLDSGSINFPARNRKIKPKKKIKITEDKTNIPKEDVLKMLILKFIEEKKRKNSLIQRGYIGENKTPAWTRKEGKSATGGLNQAGIRSYRRANPGSKLSMAVTTKPSKLKVGSKSWKRRKRFCARMSGMPGAMYKKGKPTRKKLSLNKWNC